MNKCFVFHKVCSQRTYLRINLSRKMQVQNISVISIFFPLFIHDNFKNQTIPNETSCVASGPFAVVKKVYLGSRKKPSSTMSHHHFPKPRTSLLVLQQPRVMPAALKIERKTTVIQKVKIKKQIPDFIHRCDGKIIQSDHWNYHWKKLQYSHRAAPKMQWNGSFGPCQVLTIYHIFHSFKSES